MVEEIGVVLPREVEIVAQVVFRAAQILDADEIGVLLAQPVIETIARGLLNAVGTETDDPHAWPLAERACIINPLCGAHDNGATAKA